MGDTPDIYSDNKIYILREDNVGQVGDKRWASITSGYDECGQNGILLLASPVQLP